MQYQRTKLTTTAARLFFALALTLSSVNLPAQDGRKLISNPAPMYPEMAKNFHIVGVVKVQVLYRPRRAHQSNSNPRWSPNSCEFSRRNSEEVEVRTGHYRNHSCPGIQLRSMN